MLKKYALGILVLAILSASSIGGMNVKRANDEFEKNSSFNGNVAITDQFFDSMIKGLMKIGHMSSISAAIVNGNEIKWVKGYGIYNREKGFTSDENTVYLVASISKTITATAIMQLQEKGLLNIDDDVNKYLPFSLRNPNYPDIPITIRMLLSHTSSLNEDPITFYAYIPGDPEIEGYPYPWLKDYLTPNGRIYIPQVWGDYPPGEKMKYANVGYGILGYVVERVSGMPFEEYCRKNIFEPLQMYNSSFYLSSFDTNRVAVPYTIYRGEYYPFLHYGILVYPAGGLRTTVIDLSHFLMAHMNGGVWNGVRILSERSVEEMHSIQAYSSYGFDYGLGWQIWQKGGGLQIGHTGGLYGVSTEMAFREDGCGIIFFTDKEIKNIREMIVFSLLERLLFWKANNYKMDELSRGKILETIKGNIHLLNDKNVGEEEINFYVDGVMKSLLTFALYHDTISSTVFSKS